MKRKKRSRADAALDAIVLLVTAVLVVVTAVPLFNVAAKAFSSETALVANRVTIYPIGFQLSTMRYVLSSALFGSSFLNSVCVCLCGTLLSLLVTALAAYPLSKRDLPLQKPLTVLFVFTMWFSGGMVPSYLVMKQLGLVNTLWSLILPGAVSVYNLLLVKNYYESLPPGLEESARVDGAGSFTILIRILVPLSLPVFATVTLFIAVAFWNDYFNPMIYITRTSLKTLPVYMRDIIVDSQTDATMLAADDRAILPEGVRAATIVAATVPILLVYPFLQKYFVKGVLIGAVKG